jgi:hypothetical protein
VEALRENWLGFGPLTTLGEKEAPKMLDLYKEKYDEVAEVQQNEEDSKYFQVVC